jgi:F-box-like
MPPTLPPEILLQIQHHCDHNTLVRWAGTSRGWYHELRTQIWRSLIFYFDDIVYHQRYLHDQTPIKLPTAFLQAHRDLPSYLVGSYDCYRCDPPSKFRAKQWQIEAVREVTIDLVQGHPAIHGALYFSFWVIQKLLDSLPNLRQVSMRGCSLLTAAMSLRLPNPQCDLLVQFGWEQARLPFTYYEKHPRKVSREAQRLPYGGFGPHCLMANLRRFEFLGLRRCDAHPLCEHMRRMQQLTWLSIASSTHVVFDPAERERQHRNQRIILDDHATRLAKSETIVSGDYALHYFLDWLVIGSSFRDFGPRRGSNFNFPRRLQHLQLQDFHQGAELDLQQLGRALAPCHDLVELTLVGFPQGSTERALSLRDEYRLETNC